MIGKLNGRSLNQSTQLTIGQPTFSPGQILLQDLLGTSLVLSEDWEALSDDTRESLHGCHERSALVQRLVEYKLLTDYQGRASRPAKPLASSWAITAS